MLICSSMLRIEIAFRRASESNRTRVIFLVRLLADKRISGIQTGTSPLFYEMQTILLFRIGRFSCAKIKVISTLQAIERKRRDFSRAKRLKKETANESKFYFFRFNPIQFSRIAQDRPFAFAFASRRYDPNVIRGPFIFEEKSELAIPWSGIGR